MKFSDKDAKKMLQNVRSFDLEEDIANYPENERNGRSDLQILADEVSYLISLYNEETTTAEEYESAKCFLKETKNGTVMPFYDTIPPKPKYSPLGLENKVKDAKATVNEYRRLCSLGKRLKIKGYVGKW